MLRGENATPKVCGMFYCVTVQAVLLFGSETWNLASSAIKVVEELHVRAVQRMADALPTKHQNRQD